MGSLYTTDQSSKKAGFKWEFEPSYFVCQDLDKKAHELLRKAVKKFEGLDTWGAQKFFDAITNKDPEYHTKDFYLYALDRRGKFLAHGLFPQLVGHSTVPKKTSHNYRGRNVAMAKLYETPFSNFPVEFYDYWLGKLKKLIVDKVIKGNKLYFIGTGYYCHPEDVIPDAPQDIGKDWGEDSFGAKASDYFCADYSSECELYLSIMGHVIKEGLDVHHSWKDIIKKSEKYDKNHRFYFFVLDKKGHLLGHNQKSKEISIDDDLNHDVFEAKMIAMAMAANAKDFPVTYFHQHGDEFVKIFIDKIEHKGKTFYLGSGYSCIEIESPALTLRAFTSF